MSINADNVLPGAWAYVSVVTDMGGTAESEELVGYVSGDKSLSQDRDTGEWSFPEQAVTVRQKLHYTSDFEFEIAVVTDLTNLQTLGLIDTSGTNPTLKESSTVALRVDIFKEKPADHTAASDLQMDLPSVDVSADDMTLPQDGGSMSITGFVNEDPQFPNITIS